MKILAAFVLPASLLCTSADAADFRVSQLISFDGSRSIRVNWTDHTFQLIRAGSTHSDFGGVVNNCSNDQLSCVGLGSLILAVPDNKNLPDKWATKDTKFSVVGRADRGSEKVWLIQAKTGGDIYMHFSYSVRRGVESISLRAEGSSNAVATTYFTVGDRGLLAD